MASKSAALAERAGAEAEDLLQVVPGEADSGIADPAAEALQGRARACRRAGSRRRGSAPVPGRGHGEAERPLLPEHGDEDLPPPPQPAGLSAQASRRRPPRRSAWDSPAPPRPAGGAAGPSSSTREKNSSSVKTLRRASASGGSWWRASGSKGISRSVWMVDSSLDRRACSRCSWSPSR